MSLWSRIGNLFRSNSLSRDIDEEIESHIAEAIEQGRDPVEARRAFGSALRVREESRDIRLVGWLDSLRADAVFGWRQLKKKKVTSAAAIISLALAIGACTSAFRLIDALLLRPLPVAGADRLYALSYQGIGFDGKPLTGEGCEYPMFRLMRDAVKDQAELLAISFSNRTDLTYGSDEHMEKAYLQYVSGWMFGSFGLRPAVGRLLNENDDRKPGAHPYAVLSYDYWTRRFGRWLLAVT
jgi:putative ABC transport system permease protein